MHNISTKYDLLKLTKYKKNTPAKTYSTDKCKLFHGLVIVPKNDSKQQYFPVQ